MKNKFIIAVFLLIVVFPLTACDKQNINNDAAKFKEDYESLNGVVNSEGKEHRTLSISKDNPFVFSSGDEIVKKIENKETFYVYFGSKLCPWCRSVIEKATLVAKSNGIDTIYYVDIWDDEANEIFRDKYTLENGIPKKTINGTDSYYKLLDYFDNILSDYQLSDSEGNSIETFEKRIFAPNFVYVKNGKAIKLTSGISENQKDAREKLTDELLQDEEKSFNEFFSNKN
jgi:thiol-disulfide isomerase/thioredoxin